MNEALLVVGHNHSRTKITREKIMNLTGIGKVIGFRICEIPKKYQNEFEKPLFNKNGYSFYHFLY